MFAAWFQTFARADTIEVGSDQPTIRAAISAARPGDEILVPAGVYDESLLIGKDLSLIGDPSAATPPVLTNSSLGQSILEVIGPVAVTVRGFTFDRDDNFGSALSMSNGPTVIVDQVSFVGDPDRPGPDVFAESATLTLTHASLDVGTAFEGAGAHLQAFRSDLTIEDSTFVGGQAELGGAIFLSESSATLRRSTFTDNFSGFGGAIGIEALPGDEVLVEDCVFEGNEAAALYGYDGFGGAIHQIDGALIITGSTFRSNQAQIAGAVEYVGPSLTISGCLFEANEAPLDSAVALDNVESATITASTFRDNLSDLTGTIAAYSSTTDLEIAGNLFCDNQAGDHGGAIFLESNDQSSTAAIHHNRFVGSSADGSGGAIRVGAATVEIVQNTIVDSTSGLGAVAVERQGVVTFVNNAIVGGTGGGLFAEGGSELLSGYNLYFDNAPPVIGEDLSEGDLEEAPGFVASSPYDCESNLAPGPGSALIDAGDPERTDDDGTRSDIGATGGEGATALVDVDGDGVVGPDDCAPFDPAVAGASPEVVADGIDQDCDGLEPCYVDADGDGRGSNTTAIGPVGCAEDGLSAAGGDCDDLDPRNDADCGPGVLPPSWFCAHGGPAGGLATWIGALVVTGRRRRGNRR